MPVTSDRATILCVDDEVNQLTLWRLVLEKVGYRVLTADSYRSALEIFQSNSVDLAMLDYWMAGGSGVRLAAELKQHREKLPIVILSGYSELPGETIGVADAWITKGGASETVLAKIAELLPHRIQPTLPDRDSAGKPPVQPA